MNKETILTYLLTNLLEVDVDKTKPIRMGSTTCHPVRHKSSRLKQIDQSLTSRCQWALPVPLHRHNILQSLPPVFQCARLTNE